MRGHNQLETRILIPIIAIAVLGAAPQPVVQAGGLPEPGLVMYGAVRNAASGNARLISGTLTWTITPPSGQSITLTSSLVNVGNQFSYYLRVPFETLIGNITPSPNVLQLNSTTTTYVRTSVTITIGTNVFRATIVAPASGTFTFGPADRGRTEQVDLVINGAAIDTYGIGIPDTWQTAHFGYVGIDPSADPDHDGMSNLAEYIAGTDPKDPNSVFRFSAVNRIAPGVLQLQWLSQTNRTYTVYSSATLGSNSSPSAFAMVMTKIPATPPVNTVIVANPPSQMACFYRIQVTLSTFAQWLVNYGLPDNANPNFDLLNKGMTLIQEFIAGTNPNDPTSAFKFTNIELLTPRVTELQWLSATNRLYTVFESTDIVAAVPTFTQLGSNISATPPINSFLVTNTPSQEAHFYRLQVQ